MSTGPSQRTRASAEPAGPPDPVRWDAPLPGGWLRHFRWGEWLPEPPTPLFESWFLDRSEARFHDEQAAACGVRPPRPLHVLVNGWYFHSPVGSGGAPVMLRALLSHPRFALAFMRHNARPDLTERICAAPHLRAWEQDLLPRYRQLVAAGSARVAAAPAEELVALVDELADLSGALMWSVSMVGGFAWKAESSLAHFFQKQLARQVPASHQGLLAGLTRPAPAPAHAVSSLDWYHPTVGELGLPPTAIDPTRFDRIEQQRRQLETTCRQTLAARARLLARFETRLAIAQRYAVVREEQIACLTLGWPLLRRAVLRLGATLVERYLLAAAGDVFFLSRAELAQSLSAGARRPALMQDVAPRQAAWQRNRRLAPPLVVGRLPGFLANMIASTVRAMRTPPRAADAIGAGSTRPATIDILIGMPASPGRARGPARVLLEPSGFERFLPGDVLVAPATTPAWTPLFERAAAVVTDAGSVTAHASLIAREYGIPAVVATGDATRRLRDGQIVTVDGSAGRVELTDARTTPPST